VASDIRNTKRFRELAGFLRERAGQEGVTFVAGEAEKLLAEQLAAVAGQLRVTQRTVLDRYMTEESLELLAQQLGSLAESYHDAVDTTAPITIETANAGRVIAALGLALKLAAEHVDGDQADAIGIATDCADAMVGIGAAIRAADGAARLQLGGQALVWTRTVLLRTIELIRDGRWTCPCPGPHKTGSACRLQNDLTGDLHLVGGWLPESG